MEKLTFAQLEEIINSKLFREQYCTPEQFMREGDEVPTPQDIEANPDDYSDEFKEEFKKLGAFELVDSFGGEGQGDDYWSVFHFKDHDVYIQFDGWYRSYNGSKYNDMFEVKPVEVVVTQYHRVEK